MALTYRIFGDDKGTMPDDKDIQSHYDAMLARHYVWMAGGWDAGCGKSRRFFEEHAIRPNGSGIAVDLGAGCGFLSIALAGAGFRVTAVDRSREMLDILRQHAEGQLIRTVIADILDFPAWDDNEKPELIACTGDTLTHLADMCAVKRLLRQCARELSAGGTLILSCRDYSREPSGSSVVIPVQREANRIFLCRLCYETDRVMVEDILYTRESGQWERTSGKYPKIRIAPDLLEGLFADEGFRIRPGDPQDEMITLIGQKL